MPPHDAEFVSLTRTGVWRPALRTPRIASRTLTTPPRVDPKDSSAPGCALVPPGQPLSGYSCMVISRFAAVLARSIDGSARSHSGRGSVAGDATVPVTPAALSASV